MGGNLILFCIPRSGSHMVRSMLVADPRVTDLGIYDINDASYAGLETFVRAGATGKKLTVVQVICHVSYDHAAFVAAAGRLGAAVIFLRREDLLAQVASRELMRKTGVRVGEPVTADVVLDHDHSATEILQTALMVEQVRIRLEESGLPFAELTYEQACAADSLSRLADVVERLTGVRVAVGQPTTVKLAPPLREFVLNIKTRSRWGSLDMERRPDSDPDLA